MRKLYFALSLFTISLGLNAQVCQVAATKDLGACQNDSTIISVNAWTTLPVNPIVPLNYCIANINMNGEADISRIRFGAINNASNCMDLSGTQGMAMGDPGRIADYTASNVPVATFQAGSSHVLEIENAPCNWYGTYSIFAHIDFNHDGNFSGADETVLQKSLIFQNSSSHRSIAELIQIPSTAMSGPTRMRISSLFGNFTNTMGCGTALCGEVEDYFINIDNQSYTYTWSPSTGLNTSNGQFVKAKPNVTTTYTITAMSANGDVGSTTITIVPSGDGLLATATTDPANCHDGTGSISLNVINASTTNYTYSWYPQGIVSSTTATAQNLVPGTYGVLVTDDLGCKDSVVATLVNPLPIQTSAQMIPVQCFSGADGSISLSSSGGTPNFSYEYNGQTLNGNVVNNLAAGTYVIRTIDNQLCESIDTFTITQPPFLQLTAYGGINAAQAYISGGTPGYSFLWTPGNYTSSNISGVTPGNYQLTVTDAHNCTATANVKISAALDVKENDLLTFRVYPNPAQTTIQIEAEDPIEYLELFNLQGQQLIQMNGSNNKSIRLDIASLPLGSYLLRLNHHQNQMIHKQ